jgi:hypothetical protein
MSSSSPLEDEIADLIYGGLADIFLDATLIHDTLTPGSPTADVFDPRPPTANSYSCKAIVETYSELTKAMGFASLSDRKIMVLTKSLSITPTPNDRITIRGQTFTILEVDADPAKATWELKCRV